MANNKRRPTNYRQLLTAQNAKTSKGELLGYYTGILYLSPANESGLMNTCTSATEECMQACLKDSGRMSFQNARNSRLSKTLLLHSNRELFLQCLRWDIEGVVRRAAKRGMTPAIRINGTSDLAWIALQMSAEYPQVQFYDYTKHIRPETRWRDNYWVTYSYSGHNLAESLRVLSVGGNVSVVFTTKRGKPLPETWQGYRVIDGDKHDLRFLDDKGVVVGLRLKGHKAIRAGANSFVVEHQLINIELGKVA